MREENGRFQLSEKCEVKCFRMRTQQSPNRDANPSWAPLKVAYQEVSSGNR